MECSNCGYMLSAFEKDCARCKSGFRPAKPATVLDSPFVYHEEPAHEAVNLPFVSGLLGSLLLMAGVFAPLVSVPLLGGVTYISKGGWEGWTLFGAGVFALALTLLSRAPLLRVPATLATGVLVFDLTLLEVSLNEMRHMGDGAPSLANAFTGMFGGLAASAVQLEWAFPLLVIATILLYLGSVPAELLTPNPNNFLRATQGLFAPLLLASAIGGLTGYADARHEMNHTRARFAALQASISAPVSPSVNQPALSAQELTPLDTNTPLEKSVYLSDIETALTSIGDAEKTLIPPPSDVVRSPSDTHQVCVKATETIETALSGLDAADCPPDYQKAKSYIHDLVQEDTVVFADIDAGVSAATPQARDDAFTEGKAHWANSSHDMTLVKAEIDSHF